MKRRVLPILALLAGLIVIPGILASCSTTGDKSDQEETAALGQMRNILDKDAGGEEGVWSQAELAESYRYGQNLHIPERSVRIGGTETAATAILTYPDGTATRNSEAVLDMAGVYQVTYTAKAGAQTQETKESFRVPLESIQVGAGSIKKAYGPSSFREEVEGVDIQLAPGEAVEFAQMIDLSQATLEDILARVYVIPSVMGVSDFNSLMFRLTDVENPDNYLAIQARFSADGDDYPFTYISAGGSGQPLAGYSEWENKVHTNTAWGTSITVSFSGNYARLDRPVEPGQYYVGLSYDQEQNALYAGSGERDFTLVADFDDLKYFDQAWEGFPGGKVRLSITADGYKSSFAHIFVAEVKDCDLTLQEAEDLEPPVITVESQEAMPAARVGYSYPIPEASARDTGSGSCAVETAVFFDYQTDAPVSINVKDQRFATEREGWYAIVYTAVDPFGNIGQKAVWVYAEPGDAPYRVQVSEEGRIQTACTGERVPVAEYETTGGSGESQVQIRVTVDEEEIPLKDGEFCPEREGVYTVSYTATDILNQVAEASYEVRVEDSPEPVFAGSPALPKYLISGSSYQIPECKAYRYSGKQRKDAEVSMELRDKNGSRTVEDSFQPEVDENGETVALTFRAGSTELSFEIPCLAAYESDGSMQRLNMSNYLVTGDCALERGKDGIAVTARSPEAGWEFANRLPAEGMYLEIAPDTEGNAFEGLAVTLTDSEDSDVSVTIALGNTDSGNSLIEAGKKSVVMKSLFYPQEAEGLFRVGYKNQCIYVNDTCVAIEKTDGQESFQGFPSGYVYLAVTFENAVPDKGSYRLKTICDQIMNNSSNDRTGPLIVLSGEYGGTADFGSLMTSKPAAVADVLDPTVKAGLTVTAPSGEPVTDGNGLLLENVDPGAAYSFEASQYGQYLFTFTAEDTSERSSIFAYAVTVDDLVKPVVTVKEQLPDEISLGEVLEIPDFTVSDNVTGGEELKVAVNLLTSDGQMVTLPKGTGGYKPARTGIYELRITAADKAGNIGMYKGRVKVK